MKQAKYLVTQKWCYTVSVEVDADSEKEAKDKANDVEGKRIWDDHLYDETARRIGDRQEDAR